MRRGVALVVLVLTGCPRLERPHPRLAEATSPMHVTVRTLDLPDADCDTSVMSRVGCWVRPKRTGVTYVEVGASADEPLKTKGRREDLEVLELRSNTHVMLRAPQKRATIEFDPEWTSDGGPNRVAVSAGEDGVVLFVKDNVLTHAESGWDETSHAPRLPDGGLNWAALPRPPRELPSVDLDTMTADEIAAFAKEPDGLEALVEGLRLDISLDLELAHPENVERVWALADETQRAHLREEVLSAARQGLGRYLAFVAHHRELQDAELEAAMFEGLETPMLGLGTTLPSMALTHLPKLAGEVACRVIEAATLGADLEGGSLEDTSPQALALVARLKVSCPWVRPLLERARCRPELSCAPEESTAIFGLCSELQRKDAVETALSAQLAGNYEESAHVWAPALLEAARTQGPLPAEFGRRWERRTYHRKVSMDESGEPCVDDERLARWLCELPLDVTRSTLGECRLEVDDQKATVTVTPVAH